MEYLALFSVIILFVGVVFAAKYLVNPTGKVIQRFEKATIDEYALKVLDFLKLHGEIKIDGKKYISERSDGLTAIKIIHGKNIDTVCAVDEETGHVMKLMDNSESILRDFVRSVAFKAMSRV